jgi:hypothetical protein
MELYSEKKQLTSHCPHSLQRQLLRGQGRTPHTALTPATENNPPRLQQAPQHKHQKPRADHSARKGAGHVDDEPKTGYGNWRQTRA